MGCETMVACNPASLMAFFQSARGAHGTRRDDREDRRLRSQADNAHGDFAQVLRLVFGQENHLRFAGKGFDVSGVGEAARAYVAADDLFEIFFEEGNVALGHLDHARAVGMTAGNRSAKIRQAGRNHCPKIPRAVNPDLHNIPQYLSTLALPVRQRTGGLCTRGQ
jgi:hypothetical protein